MSKFVTKRTTKLKRGTELDWFVSKCLKDDPRQFYLDPDGWGVIYVVFKNTLGEFRFQPSTNWSQGGPLMEQIKAGVRWDPGSPEYGDEPCWGALGGEAWATGDTMLVAAMRALVLDTLGETVQVPKEISC